MRVSTHNTSVPRMKSLLHFIHSSKKDLSIFKEYNKYLYLQAYRRGLYGPRYVWITVNWGDNWWVPQSNSTHGCTEEELMTVLEGGFTIIPRGFFLRSDTDAETVSGIVSKDNYTYKSVEAGCMREWVVTWEKARDVNGDSQYQM